MTAYYNEHDPYAAQWLRNLIEAGLIAHGVVDERSIEDVTPEELKGYTQCHFFAGIGVWSLALRKAGWPDDRPVWTGSCPCQPFSSAGKAGGFDDERHLWPHFHYLIQQCGPPDVYGEQVASKDGLTWLDLVQTDMEASGYAFGALDLCAAGVGAPHMRQRLFFVAQRMGNAIDPGLEGLTWNGHEGDQPGRIRTEQMRSATEAGGAGRVADSTRDGCRKGSTGEIEKRPPAGRNFEGQRADQCGKLPAGSKGSDVECAGGLADADRAARREDAGSTSSNEKADGGEGRDGREQDSYNRYTGNGEDRRPGPTNGFWRDADWLGCRDEKWRPVRPSTFPLAHGAPSRVGRLRAYGNAINAEAATHFIESTMNIVVDSFDNKNNTGDPSGDKT